MDICNNAEFIGMGKICRIELKERDPDDNGITRLGSMASEAQSQQEPTEPGSRNPNRRPHLPRCPAVP